MQQKIIDLFDRYTHGGMTRRDFLEKLGQLAGSAAAANTLLPLLENNYALADQVPASDPRLKTADSNLAEGAQGYLAMPAAGTKFPGVLVIHENRGLNPHIRDMARRVALEGFIAFAPDYLNGHGGTPADSDKAIAMIGALTPDEILATSKNALHGLEAHAGNSGKTGAIGFCWGGGQVNLLAVADPTLKAAVAYYGLQPKAIDVPKIAAPLLLHYAGLDTRIGAGIADFEAALKANHKTYELYIYDGVNHAFNNDTNAARYNRPAADLAWGRTVAFLKKYLS